MRRSPRVLTAEKPGSIAQKVTLLCDADIRILYNIIKAAADLCKESGVSLRFAHIVQSYKRLMRSAGVDVEQDTCYLHLLSQMARYSDNTWGARLRRLRDKGMDSRKASIFFRLCALSHTFRHWRSAAASVTHDSQTQTTSVNPQPKSVTQPQEASPPSQTESRDAAVESISPAEDSSLVRKDAVADYFFARSEKSLLPSPIPPRFSGLRPDAPSAKPPSFEIRDASRVLDIISRLSDPPVSAPTRPPQPQPQPQRSLSEIARHVRTKNKLFMMEIALRSWKRHTLRVSPPRRLIRAIDAVNRERGCAAILGPGLSSVIETFPTAVFHPLGASFIVSRQMGTLKVSADTMQTRSPRLNPAASLCRPVDLRRFDSASRALRRVTAAIYFAKWRSWSQNSARARAVILGRAALAKWSEVASAHRAQRSAIRLFHQRARLYRLRKAWNPLSRALRALEAEKKYNNKKFLEILSLVFYAWRRPIARAHFENRALTRLNSQREFRAKRRLFRTMRGVAEAECRKKERSERLFNMFLRQSEQQIRPKRQNRRQSFHVRAKLSNSTNQTLDKFCGVNSVLKIFIFWRTQTRTTILTKSDCAQADRFRSTALAYKTLFLWRKLIILVFKERAFAAHLDTVCRTRILSRIFLEWRECRQSRATRRTCSHRFVVRKRKGHVFSFWRIYTKTKLRNDKIADAISCRVRSRALGNAFHAVRARADSLAAASRILQKIIIQHRKKICVSALDAWRTSAIAKLKISNANSEVSSNRNMRLQHKALHAWISFFKQQRSFQTNERALKLRMRRHLLRQVWASWCSVLRRRVKGEETMADIFGVSPRGIARLAFSTWKQNASRSSQIRIALAAVSQRAQINLLGLSFTLWAKVYGISQNEKRCRLLRQQRTKRKVLKTFHKFEWQTRYGREERLARRQRKKRECMSLALRAWRSRSARNVRAEQEVTLRNHFAQLSQVMSLLRNQAVLAAKERTICHMQISKYLCSVFQCWRFCSVKRQAAVLVGKKLALDRSVTNARAIYTTWREKARFQRGSKILQRTVLHYSVYSPFENWRQYTIYRREKAETVLSLSEKLSSMNRGSFLIATLFSIETYRPLALWAARRAKSKKKRISRDMLETLANGTRERNRKTIKPPEGFSLLRFRSVTYPQEAAHSPVGTSVSPRSARRTLSPIFSPAWSSASSGASEWSPVFSSRNFATNRAHGLHPGHARRGGARRVDRKENSLDTLLLLRAVVRWALLTRHSLQAKQKLQKAQIFKERRLCKIGLLAFAQNVKKKRAKRAGFEFYAISRQSQFLKSWRFALRKRLSLKASFRRFVSIARPRALSKAFGAWANASEKAHTCLSLYGEALAVQTRNKLYSIFSSWFSLALRHRRLRVTSSLIRQRVETRKLRQGLFAWKQELARAFQDNATVQRVSHKLDMTRRLYAFRAWSSYITRKKLEEAAAQEHLLRIGANRKRALLRFLRDQLSLREQSRRLFAKAQQYNETQLLQKMFGLWSLSAAHASLLHLQEGVADEFSKRSLLQRLAPIFFHEMRRRRDIMRSISALHKHRAVEEARRLVACWLTRARGAVLERNHRMFIQKVSFSSLRSRFASVADISQRIPPYIRARQKTRKQLIFHAMLAESRRKKNSRLQAARLISSLSENISLQNGFASMRLAWLHRRMDQVARRSAARTESRIFGLWRRCSQTRASRLRSAEETATAKRLRGTLQGALCAWKRVFHFRLSLSFAKARETALLARAYRAVLFEFKRLAACEVQILTRRLHAAQGAALSGWRRSFCDAKASRFRESAQSTLLQSTFVGWRAIHQLRTQHRLLELTRIRHEDNLAAASRFHASLLASQARALRATCAAVLTRWRGLGLLARTNSKIIKKKAFDSMTSHMELCREYRASADAFLGAHQAARTLTLFRAWKDSKNEKVEIRRVEQKHQACIDIEKTVKRSAGRSVLSAHLSLWRQATQGTLQRLLLAELHSHQQIEKKVARTFALAARRATVRRARAIAFEKIQNRRILETAFSQFLKVFCRVQTLGETAAQFSTTRVRRLVFPRVLLATRASVVARRWRLVQVRPPLLVLRKQLRVQLRRNRTATLFCGRCLLSNSFFQIKNSAAERQRVRAEKERSVRASRSQNQASKAFVAWRRDFTKKKQQKERISLLTQETRRLRAERSLRAAFRAWGDRTQHKLALKLCLQKWKRAERRRIVRAWHFVASIDRMRKLAHVKAADAYQSSLKRKAFIALRLEFAASSYVAHHADHDPNPLFSPQLPPGSPAKR
eukprot:gnl/Chilomastix_cuspidata/4935.p1 GENE.gnl/Chilomastix_cuspidata/4935~~gnl/Chilomastix_cuspidata/4935.p1  ORF type:complete len:2271 (-),score=129.14 gnl/Chilomastix_cuspidata/4935:133-6945(-)